MARTGSGGSANAPREVDGARPRARAEAPRSDVLGGWLSGPGAAADGTMPAGPSLGLPVTGPGSAAGIGRRFVGTMLDLLAALLIGRAIILADPHSGVWGVTSAQTFAFVLEVWLLQASTGQSIGQRVTATRVVSVDGRPAGRWWLLLRTILPVITCFLVCVIVDRDGRGLHDKAAGTVVVTV